MQFLNYSAANKKKWKTVVVFETVPRDHPETSKEGKEVAKFVAMGDAFSYVKGIMDAPDPMYVLIVIR